MSEPLRVFLRRLFVCWLLDEHRNALAESRKLAPLFPIRCDDCGGLFYRVHVAGQKP